MALGLSNGQADLQKSKIHEASWSLLDRFILELDEERLQAKYDHGLRE